MLGTIGEVHAFEHDETALAVARGKAGALPADRLQQGTLPHALPEAAEPFDLVVAFDVIEHVEKDRESLVALRRCLRPEGALVMTVPAHPFLWSRHDETHHHFRRYTRAMLRERLEAAGYEVEHLTHYNALLFPLVVAVRAAKRLLRLRDADDAMPSPPVNAVLRRVFAAERFWVGRVRVPFGVSLLAVARPRAETASVRAPSAALRAA